jgi:prevent-host-death family protein
MTRKPFRVRATHATLRTVRTLSHREFRNQSAVILRAVQAGESFLLTNDGQPVGKLVPVAATEPELRVSRPATARGGFSELPRHRISESIAGALADLRGDR